VKPEINSGIVTIYWLVTPVALLKDGVGCAGEIDGTVTES